MTAGTTIAGRYRLLRPLGKGSMGEVWAALHLTLGREVAVKLIYEGSPELASRLKREALACGRLDHPNIVRVYDFGETDGGDPFLVMEQLTGETLADRLERRHRLPVEEAVTIALEIARALRAAHEAGVVHRDLKPANVFLCEGAEGVSVKVLDFGVSKILTSFDMSVTTAGSLVGSPAYMSPEQARALPEIDERADLWSMGVLLFEMLTGTRPFSAPTVMGVVTEILAGPIPTLAAIVPEVDPRLDAAVGRCLTREVDLRMPSAVALCEALASLQTSALAAFEDMPTVAERGACEDFDQTVQKPSREIEDEETIARPPPAARSESSDDDDERETAVMTGRDVLAFRMQNRTLATQRLPATMVDPPKPAVEAAATLLLPPQGLPPLQDSAAIIPVPQPVAAPNDTPPPSWDTADTLRRTKPAPPSSGEADAATPAPGWERRNNAQTLWMTAIAGLVLGLVVFAGLSLLR